MPMLRYKKRHPAAPELLGSKSADGAEHFDIQADNDQEDTLSACVNQLFPARWIVQHFALSPHRAALVAALANLGRTHDGEVAAAGRQAPALVKRPGTLKTTAIEEAVQCSAALESNVVCALGADRFAPLFCPVPGVRDG